MNVLLLAEDLGPHCLDQAGLWLSEMAERWAARGHRVWAVCAASPAEPGGMPEGPAGVTVWRPGPEGFETALGEALLEPPDVVHVTTCGPFGPRVLEILRELPVLLDVHDFWPICPNSDLRRRPHLSSCAEHFPFRGCGACAGLLRLRAMEGRGELVASARMIVAHSGINRTRLGRGLDRPVELLDYGVDTQRFRPDADPPSSPAVRRLFATSHRPRVLFLGPPTAARGAGMLTDLLVALKARVAEAEMVVVGRDPDNPDWEHMFRTEAKELGLGDQAIALASVPAGDLPALFRSCRVALAPGDGPERGNLFLLQALASSLPVVASLGDGSEQLVRHGEHGLLVGGREVPAFADALATLLTDPVARFSFGEAGRLAAIERHDIERSVFGLQDLYRRVRLMPAQPAAA